MVRRGKFTFDRDIPLPTKRYRKAPEYIQRAMAMEIGDSYFSEDSKEIEKMRQHLYYLNRKPEVRTVIENGKLGARIWRKE